MTIDRVLRRVVLALGCALAPSCTATTPRPEAGRDASPSTAPGAPSSEAPPPEVAPPAAPPPAAPSSAAPDGSPRIELAIDLDAIGLSPSLNRAWVEKDLERIEQLANAFPPRSLTEALAAFDEAGKDCTPHAQGLGIEDRTCPIPGGYTTCWVTLVTYEGELFRAHAGCRGSEESWSEIAPVTERAYAEALVPRGFRVEGRMATATWVDETRQRRMDDALASKLGPRAEVEVPPALRDAVELLTSPHTHNVLGTACGYAGTPPEAHRAMIELVDAGRDDLLRNAMRGLNAGGRVYGYIGLRLLGKNTRDDDATYDTLRALDVPLEACGGCRTQAQSSARLDLAPFEHARERARARR